MRIISMLLLLCGLSLPALAGKIVGKVSDEKTGEPVIGATVMIKGSSNGTATDVDGNFQLTVAAGTHTLEVKYIGYQTKEIDGVQVKGDETVTVNVIISEASSTQLNEVVVRSSLKKENISALYVMQKNAVSVSSGISADLIQRSPDRNTGEVLKRVSGASIQNGKFVIIRGLSERYNAAMINGAQMQSTEPDKKAFSYDVIPSNLIDNIIINKTASADLPGDFAGGVVQVLTKDVPDKNFVNVGLTLGYNTQATFQEQIHTQRSTANNFGFSGAKEKLPSAFGDSYTDYRGMTSSDRLNSAKQLENRYPVQRTNAMPNLGFQLSAGNSKTFSNGAKLGTVLGINYRNGYNQLPDFLRSNYDGEGVNASGVDASSRFTASTAVLANFAYVKDRNKITFRNIFNAIHDENYYQREGTSISSLQQLRLYSTVPLDRRLYSTQLDGDHALGTNNVKLYWNLNYSNLTADVNDLRTAFYARNISFTQDNQVVVDESVPFKIVDRNSRRFFSTLKDNSFGGNFNVSIPFTLFDQKQSVKAGYLGLAKNRDFNARVFQYQAYDINSFDESLTTKLHERIFDPNNIGATGFELLEITNPTDAYTASSMLNAGFLMLDNHLSEQWRLSWGVRFESYTQRLKATDLSGSKIDQTTTFSDVLPSLNLSFSPNEETKVRFSASRTVNRPEFREIAPFQFLDFENNWTLVGNPVLKRANVTNLDLRYEYYPAPGEAITIGAFYKHFESPIEAKMDDQSNLDLFIFGYQNAPSAKALGAELEVRKNLSFIADKNWLQNTTLGANITYINSEVQVSSFGGAGTRPLQGQSPYLINLSALYNDPKTGLGFSALYNRIGERIFIVGSRDIPTTWERARDVIDFQISKSLMNKKAEIKLTASDLLNQHYIFYWNSDGKNAYSASDRAFQKYRLGSTFTLGFTYRF